MGGVGGPLADSHPPPGRDSGPPTRAPRRAQEGRSGQSCCCPGWGWGCWGPPGRRRLRPLGPLPGAGGVGPDAPRERGPRALPLPAVLTHSSRGGGSRRGDGAAVIPDGGQPVTGPGLPAPAVLLPRALGALSCVRVLTSAVASPPGRTPLRHRGRGAGERGGRTAGRGGTYSEDRPWSGVSDGRGRQERWGGQTGRQLTFSQALSSGSRGGTLRAMAGGLERGK